MNRHERRAFRRFRFRLPLEYWPADGTSPLTRRRTVTEDVSPRGVRFEAGDNELRVGSLLNLHLAAPPGPGHFPFEVHLASVARVVRIENAGPDAGRPAGDRPGPPQQRVAVQFTRPLRVLMAES